MFSKSLLPCKCINTLNLLVSHTTQVLNNTTNGWQSLGGQLCDECYKSPVYLYNLQCVYSSGDQWL